MGRDQISRDQLLAELQRVRDDLGRPPKVADIRGEAEYSYHTYRRRFGGIAEALDAAGINYDEQAKSHGPKGVNKEALVTELKQLEEDLNRRPCVTDVRGYSDYSLTTYYNNFDSFGDALEAAGIE